MRGLANEDRPQKWTAGVDWFRYRTNDFEDTRPLLHAIRDVQQEDTQKASRLRPWRFQGYDGWQTDTIRYGQRNGRVIWESSGSAAQRTLGLSALCTGSAKRIDLQITLQLCTPLPTFGSSLLRSITQSSISQHRNQIRCGLHTETTGLWLGTVGRRTHRSYLRIYDKGVESRQAVKGKMWRIELEAKHSHAAELWLRNQHRLKDPEFCAAYCVSSLKSSGCSWPYGDLGTDEVDIALGRDQRTTPSRLAGWLINSVAPTIPRLLTVFSVHEVLEMLSLSDVAAPTGKDNAQR
jgi:hypothetical protein